MGNPVVSFIVPVRDRLEVLSCVQTILSIASDNIECVVSDNSSRPTPGLSDLQQRDHRLRVVRPHSTLSMSDNFEFALEHARGEWIFPIGGDDGVVSHRFERVFGHLTSTESDVVSGGTVDFFWPGAFSLFHSQTHERVTGRLSWWSSQQLASLKRHDPHSELSRIAQGRRKTQVGFSPPVKIYGAGALRVSALRKIRSQTGGRVFASQTPDWFCSVAASAAKMKVSWLPVSFVIQGASLSSNGLKTVRSQRWRMAGAHFSRRQDGPMALNGSCRNFNLLLLDAWNQAMMGEPLESSVSRRNLLRWVMRSTPSALTQETIDLLTQSGFDVPIRVSSRLALLSRFPWADIFGRLSVRKDMLLALLLSGQYVRVIDGPLNNLLDVNRLLTAWDNHYPGGITGRGAPVGLRQWRLLEWSGISVRALPSLV